MLKKLRSRRHPRYTTHIAALIAAVLLLLSVTILYIRLTSDRHSHHHNNQSSDLTFNPLLEEFDLIDRIPSDDDKIDILDDTIHDDPDPRAQDDENENEIDNNQSRVSKYYFDHVQGVIRRAFDKRSIDQWEDYASFDSNFDSKTSLIDLAFSSDDIVLNDNVRTKLAGVIGIEDALLLTRVSNLRQGWGNWFEKKSDFLRRDRMFKSNLELLNPLNNPFLQDPDGVGVTLFSKGDKLIQKRIVREFKNVPFVSKKRISVSDAAHDPVSKTKVESEIKIAERRTLDDNVGSRDERDKNGDEMKSEFLGQIFADGKRWGYFPGLHPRLSFLNFMDAFFRKGKCSMRVFMVWNSPPWMFSVRHQRGLESLLFHHRDACVVVFSETIELNFFDGFVKDG